MPRASRLPVLLLLAAGLLPAPGAPRAHAAEETEVLAPPATWLVLDAVDPGGRTPFPPDAVFRDHLLDPQAPPPRAGELVRGMGGREARWREVATDPSGDVVTGRGAWAFATLPAQEDGIWMAELGRAATLFVDGVAHGGDVYGQGHLRTPVRVRAGGSRIAVRAPRGRFRLTLRRPPAPLHVAAWDAQLPEPVVGRSPALPAMALVVVNASAAWSPPGRLSVHPRLPGVGTIATAAVPPLAPLATMRVPVEAAAADAPPRTAGPFRLRVQLLARDDAGRAMHHARTFETVVRTGDEARRVPFVSGIDGSVQHYAVRPPLPEAGEAGRRRLLLSLHGASVDALGQARAYAPKPDVVLVAPTNRRPFGFDWQDWGRRDAYEALAHALAAWDVDRRDVHVTGHSMGGHGAWHLAANDADGFASCAPSAGWVSFDSYGGRPDGRLRPLWDAADPTSRTLDLIDNLARMPVFVLHGEADDNVPVSEARTMLDALDAAGAERVEHHVQPGAGHWWNVDPAPGADCVDWPGILAMVRRHRIPADPAEIAFSTAGPGVDERHHWARVLQALEPGPVCRVKARWDAAEGRVEATTQNARWLVLERPAREIVLDGQAVAPSEHGHVRVAGRWVPARRPPPANEKRPGRTGPFKRAFDRRFVLVVGTAGDDAEDAALLERARHDAQVWQMRAAGLAWIVRDTDLLASPGDFADRNLILYGNADSNGAWDAVVPEACPVRLERGRAVVGSREHEGEDLAAFVVHPRRGEPTSLVGIVGDTGAAGTRLGLRANLFISGVGIPDYVLWGPEVLDRRDAGVRQAGFFDVRWQLAE